MFSGYFNTVLYLNMNVKKESLRIKILDFLSSHPRSEVKDIASYVQITKQALYYHIKLLSRQEKIKIVDTQIINGIEKKFYSLFDDNTESISDSEVTNDSHQNLTSNINTANNKTTKEITYIEKNPHTDVATLSSTLLLPTFKVNTELG